MEKQEQEGICVAIRMRGLNEREIKSGSAPIFKCLTNERVALLSEKDGHPIERDTYQYDKVFDAEANTNNIYDHVGRNLVEGVVTGINATIFAYGQTSSGKTYTMLGAQGSQGVLELAATDLFRHIGDTANRDFIVRVSFVEIYNEIIRDLLTDAADSTVNIREDPRKGVYCEASEHAIQDFDSVMTVLKKGISRRAVESTAMNDTSSRSHTIFKITVESIESQQEGVERDMSVLVASLNLVDLAGSESVRHTGATGQRAKEGGKINQSLLSLSRVIHSLSQPGTHVSFRDSKLTRLLQPSLCGNAKMSIVCCVTPAEKYIEETRSTLQFASRAKLVQTNATVNEILDESEKIRRLTKELNALREKQTMNNLSDSERDTLQADKDQLQDRLESLQSEKEEQQAQLQKLQERIFESSLPSLDNLEDVKLKKKRKTKRDTW
jgi:centromeric protein E